jgi:hypothetical protein
MEVKKDIVNETRGGRKKKVSTPEVGNNILKYSIGNQNMQTPPPAKRGALFQMIHYAICFISAVYDIRALM